MRLGVIYLFFSGAAKADTQNIQLGCVSVTCVSNGSILTTQDLTGATLSVTGNSTTTGELFIAVFVPVSSGGNFTLAGGNSTQVWSVLGEAGGNDHTYGSSIGVDPIANSVTGFLVTDYSIGSFSCMQGPPCTLDFTLPGAVGALPVGAMIVAFTEDANGNVVASTAWS